MGPTQAEAAAEEAGADQKAAKKAAVRKSGAVAGATAEGENDEAALVTALVEDCGECTNCLDKRKFGGPGLKKQKCKEPVPAGTRAAAAAAAAVALEARACAAEPKREPSLLGEPKREPSLFGEPKRDPRCAPLVAVAVASDAVAVFFADADDARQGKSAVTSADLSNRGVGAESSNELPNMDVCAVSRAEADAAAANRSSRRNPKLVVGAVSFAASTPSPAPADGCSRAEAAVSHRHPIRRRPRELVGLQDWIPSGKNWMPP